MDITFVETSRGRLDFTQRGRFSLATALNAAENIWRFTRTLIAVRPDLVYLGSSRGVSLLKHGAMAVIARFLAKPVVIEFHFSYTKFPTNGLPSLLVGWMLRSCAGMIVLSSDWLQIASRFPAQQVRFIPNGIDIRPYTALTRPRPDESGPVRLFYLGHLGREKGIYDLLQALHQLRSRVKQRYEIDLYGEGFQPGDVEDIQARANSLGLSNQVRIHPPVYGEAKLDAFAQADIFLLPSHNEGMPISIIEAMAAGLPVVATSVGGIVDQVLDGQTGFRVQPEDPDGLCSALEKLVCDRELRLRQGNAGRESARQRFDVQARAGALEVFFEGILENE